jgi:hypothetical protein
MVISTAQEGRPMGVKGDIGACKRDGATCAKEKNSA